MTSLVELIRGTEALLLDFDGPVCRVFAGYTADAVAEDLRRSLSTHGITFPADVAASADPLSVLRWVGEARPGLARLADELLTAAERRAITTAEPTAGAGDALTAAARTGRQVAIVSNNSQAAVTAYLARHQLASGVRLVVGRPFARPELMKPHTHPIAQALHELGTAAATSVLIGDSPSDMEAARAMGVRAVGYAKDAQRATELRDAHADLVIGSMRDLVNALEATA